MKRLLSAVLTLALLLIFVMPQARAGGQTKGCIALTFDDGPSGDLTKRLLDGLRARGIHATFFVCGYRVAQYPQTLCRIAQEGHEIGSHSDRHEFFTHMSADAVCADLRAAAEKIASATGRTPELLRPPGGLYDLDVIRRSVCADSPIILWSVDPEDWRGKSAAGIAAYVTKRAKSGDIILLHDMHASSVDAALRIVDTLEAQGFAFVTVSELALLSGTRLRGGETYYRFDFPKYE